MAPNRTIATTPSTSTTSSSSRCWMLVRMAKRAMSLILLVAGVNWLARIFLFPGNPSNYFTTSSTANAAVSSWESFPVLSSRGFAMDIQEFSHTVKHGNLNIVTDETISAVPRADGDEAMQYILNKIGISERCRVDPSLIVVDVGGLFGDFGLSSAERGCRTVLFEPQIHHAQQIARSILINKLQDKAKVHHVAISPKEWVAIAIGVEGQSSVKEVSSAAVDRIPTEQLDKEFKDKKILFLKVDVEGNEDEVWNTASQHFKEGQILHAIFEYTPKQFKGRGTNYETFLPRLYKAGAKRCYAVHRKKEKIFLIPEEQQVVFYEVMVATSMQTDIYCSFSNSEPNVFEGSSVVWTPTTSLVN